MTYKKITNEGLNHYSIDKNNGLHLKNDRTGKDVKIHYSKKLKIYFVKLYNRSIHKQQTILIDELKIKG